MSYELALSDSGLYARLMKYVRPNVATGCWEWNGATRGSKPYGAIKVKGKVMRAHRVSYYIFKGNIPQDKVLCHTCDNYKCINPKHLVAGTPSDNLYEAYERGRR